MSTHAQPTTGVRRRLPAEPSDLQARSWWGTSRRAVAGFRAHNLTDCAAALTSYWVLAIFPALIVLVPFHWPIGTSATQPLISNLGTVPPGPAKQSFTNAIMGIQKSQGAG